ncbi:Outer membrane scaffolding protein for murein synthesis, MipA/OmpV family [Noviherbaspirillum humi]|uniref:Outer membrane scaffolding protein for murein synthesis, MipA/OmpV family n=1 Tax=Noviherbaspirillum humi TaxID=1688639 RepID=A0A239CKX8_9BURK|nr:MipA/OmpV family protein [Noviherbaspirillum humi]SNS20358.1 Outer membrane scaffolding protein for murein synthesis, MipA/OmpV family [Noviherbaspirillum humi]
MNAGRTRSPRRMLAAFAFTAGALAASSASLAEQLPLWELGVGASVFSAPDYRGSDVSHTYALPFPYLIYRGEHLKADRNGIRTQLLESGRYELDISLNFAPGGRSRDNPARQGMPDLKPIAEIGPTINALLWESADRGMRLALRAPVRAGFTVQSPPKSIGWVFAPNLQLQMSDPLGQRGWKVGMSAGPIFNSRRVNEHFYSVSPEQATAVRPAYAAAGGYGGSQFTTTLSKRFPRYWVGAFLRYDALAGAAFEDSPLVQRRSAVTAGLAMAWVFGESSQRVQADY